MAAFADGDPSSSSSCSSWDSDDEYQKFIQKMNPPRVTIDNASCANATIIHVDSANKYGILLEVVQVLTDLKLIVRKAYISSDGGWFMDGTQELHNVFNVTNQSGQKIMDESVLEGIKDYIYKSIAPGSCFLPSRRRAIGVEPSSDYTLIELTGTDRPGLLSEVSAVLTNLDCNVVNAEVWTHNERAAAVIQITDRKSGLAISDAERLGRIKEWLRNVFKGRSRDAKTTVAMGITHTERRLHQMMLEDRDYERYDKDRANANPMPMVSVVNWLQKDYSVVTMRCKDRPKLLFDTVCTLTDMQYVVYHGSVDTEGPQAYQEYYIRHIDGSPVNSEAERKRIIQCLEAAIERRVSEGLKLELSSGDRVGLLSDVTRIFRENGLTVTRAEVSTRGNKAINTFYVRDTAGSLVELKTLEAIRQDMGQTVLQVKGHPDHLKSTAQESPTRFLFSSLFRPRSL
ncbi:ACT domain-containing protein ACR4-like isoform X1 [Panicum miliaceum]|uniref:ACT domain-containing protein ACR n=1 Tax=Panicum miliaceum TaxID=4540 RepID=A0A3L6S4N0_PANMI|nr:ACT domain-containing protein ACR4-like isoform X1 [Panicum miliaceum]